MKNSTLPFPFAKAMDVINQVMFLYFLASFTNGKLENADVQKIASQLKVTHYDWGEMTENNLYALNQVCTYSIAPENLEVTKQFPEEILSKGYPRTMSYADELHLLPTQQDVQQNWKLSFK